MNHQNHSENNITTHKHLTLNLWITPRRQFMFDPEGQPGTPDVPLFIDTPDLERRVHSHDAETSWQAAAISAADVKSVRIFVLQLLGRGRPLTDDEIYAAYRAAGGRRTPQRVRTVRESLTHPKEGLPLVKEHITIGISQFGNPARRWVVA
jgi:hypothetical protein